MPANVRAALIWSPTQNYASGSSISPAGGQSALPENPPAAQKVSGTVPNIPRRDIGAMCAAAVAGGIRIGCGSVYQFYATRSWGSVMGERGWAGRLLEWRLAGSTLTAEVSRARYFVRSERHDVTAHAEVRDHPGGRYRLELGSFESVSAAQVACEADAERRCVQRTGGTD
jgi:hypothetical protein